MYLLFKRFNNVHGYDIFSDQVFRVEIVKSVILLNFDFQVGVEDLVNSAILIWKLSTSINNVIL